MWEVLKVKRHMMVVLNTFETDVAQSRVSITPGHSLRFPTTLKLRRTFCIMGMQVTSRPPVTLDIIIPAVEDVYYSKTPDVRIITLQTVSTGGTSASRETARLGIFLMAGG